MRKDVATMIAMQNPSHLYNGYLTTYVEILVKVEIKGCFMTELFIFMKI